MALNVTTTNKAGMQINEESKTIPWRGGRWNFHLPKKQITYFPQVVNKMTIPQQLMLILIASIVHVALKKVLKNTTWWWPWTPVGVWVTPQRKQWPRQSGCEWVDREKISRTAALVCMSHPGWLAQSLTLLTRPPRASHKTWLPWKTTRPTSQELSQGSEEVTRSKERGKEADKSITKQSPQ